MKFTFARLSSWWNTSLFFSLSIPPIFPYSSRQRNRIGIRGEQYSLWWRWRRWCARHYDGTWCHSYQVGGISQTMESQCSVSCRSTTSRQSGNRWTRLDCDDFQFFQRSQGWSEAYHLPYPHRFDWRRPIGFSSRRIQSGSQEESLSASGTDSFLLLWWGRNTDLTAKKEESIGQPLERLPQTTYRPGRHISSSGDESVDGLQQLGEDHGISGVDVETRDLPPLPHQRKEDESRSSACSGWTRQPCPKHSPAGCGWARTGWF